MDQQQIKTKLIEIISCRLSVDKTSITSEFTLSDFDADYLEQAEVLIEIEKEFGLNFPSYDEIAHENFKNLCLYVEKAIKLKENLKESSV